MCDCLAASYLELSDQQAALFVVLAAVSTALGRRSNENNEILMGTGNGWLPSNGNGITTRRVKYNCVTRQKDG
jgi:hypothetical protein